MMTVMTIAPSIKQLFKSAVLASMGLVLTACSAGANTGPSASLAASADLGKPYKISRALKKALCNNRPALALGLLNKQPQSPANGLLAALALHQGGKSVTAAGLLAPLAAGNHQQRVKLSCKNGPAFDQTVSRVASQQLASVQAVLRAHDVDLAPAKALHTGLAAMKDPAASVNTKQALNTKAANQLKLNIKIEMPPSHNVAGTWFTHFSSYFDEAKAVNAIDIFEKRYDTLKGAVDYWRVSTSKGTVWRVGVAVDDWSDADRLCISVRARGDYCKIYDRLQ